MRMILNGLLKWKMLYMLLISALFYMLPVNKRKNWLLRYILWVAALLAAYLALQAPAVGWSMARFETGMQYVVAIFLAMPVQVALVAVVFYRCCDVSFQDALLGTICAYATQHFADALHSLVHMEFVIAEYGNGLCLDGGLIYFAVFAAGYFWVAKRLPENGKYDATAKQSLAALFLVLGFAIGFNFLAKIYQRVCPSPLFYICMLFDMLCCLFFLWVQLDRQNTRRLVREMELERMMRIRQKEQYEIARDSVERINRKCHDLKHQIAEIRQMPESRMREESLKEMEDAVMFYDFMVKSGNQAVDTVLTEKSLLCEQNSITWTCMADGPALDFMEEGDLYYLFDCILEYAIEMVSGIENQKQRIIALTLYRKRDMVVLQVENYAPEGRDVSLQSEQGNLKEVRNILKKYQGGIDITAEDGLVLICALIPLPKAFLQDTN